MSSSANKIQITWDDLNAAPAAEEATSQPSDSAAGPKSWGSVAAPNAGAAISDSGRGSLLLKGWFYLGGAGLLGAFLAWMICEPTFYDTGEVGFGSYFIFPLMVIFMCIGFGTAESIVERSWARAIQRGLASIGLGLVLGFIFSIIGGMVFNILSALFVDSAADLEGIERNPLFWLSRATAWAIFGMAGGLVFGIVSKSGRKISYGMLGGIIGAGLGGFLFDPICILTDGGETSRAIGLSIVGACTGAAIGLVENALKDKWLYVTSGPLAGKQFVLYQNEVTIGKDQSRTIYLFKDPDILDHHATINQHAGRSILTAFGPVIVAGQVLQGGQQHTLQTGDFMQIGRYALSYAEKERTAQAS